MLEPLTEIASTLGSSEARDSPWPVKPIEGAAFVRDQLDRGYQLGFLGSSDDHAGHPGSPRSGRPPGGLAGILSDQLTRAGVLDAMRNRRTYATNGPRIVMDVTLDTHGMGSTIPVPTAGWSALLTVWVAAPRRLDRIDIVRSGQVSTVDLKGAPRDTSIRLEVDDLRAGEYLYVRAVQRNGGAAWSSPFFITAEQ